jgi:hypothetical protein
MGRLDDQHAWAEQLGPEQMAQLAEKLAGRTFDLSHRDWFSDGRSGDPVALVMRRYRDGRAEQRVLKFFKPDQADKIDNMRTAWDDTPTFHGHLAEVGDEIEFDDGRRAVFQRIAGNNHRLVCPFPRRLQVQTNPDHVITGEASAGNQSWTRQQTSRACQRSGPGPARDVIPSLSRVRGGAHGPRRRHRFRS